MEPIEILRVSNLHTFLIDDLNKAYIVHDHNHINEPDALKRVVAIVGEGETKIDRKLLALMPNVKIISVFGAGYEGVDVHAAIERGIVVTHTPGVLNNDVADLAMGLLISVSRQIPQADRFVRAGDWVDGPYDLTKKLSAAKLGMVGLGRIGQAIAKRASAFDMKISYTARTPKAELPYLYYPSAKALAAQVDFLLAIVPGGPTTKAMINKEVFEALGPKGYFINVSSGSVVDQPALIKALQDKVIAGAGLDVYNDEPRISPEIRHLSNVVLTPHMASGTFETRRAMADLVLANLSAYFEGTKLPTPVPECQGLITK
jgi:lactate dehydrogenase-like 2-hydroxyacid dehydrogenase